MFVCKSGKHVFMYSAPTDHESALDLWQCRCIIVKMVGWGENEKKEKKKKRSRDLYRDLFWGFWLVSNEPSFHAPDMENNCCHLAESWASRPPLLPHGMPPTFAFGNKDSWGQKTDSKYLLANLYLQARPLNLYIIIFPFFLFKTRVVMSQNF